jgi:hypothetical protein
VESFPAILVPGMPHTNPSVVFTSPQGVGAIFAGLLSVQQISIVVFVWGPF